MKDNFKITFKTAVVTFAGALLLCAVTKGVANLFGVELHDQNTLELLKSYHGLKLALLVIYAIAIAPVGEELFFRGFMFRFLTWLVALKRQRMFRKVTATALAVLSSVAFVAVHYGKANPFPDTAFVGLFYFALMQCRLYVKTGRVWYPVVNHFLFNGANLLCVMAFADTI